MAKIGGIVCKECKTAKCDCPSNEAEKEKLKKEKNIDKKIR